MTAFRNEYAKNICTDKGPYRCFFGEFILFLERKSIKKNFVFASKRLRFQGFAPGNEEKLLIGEQYQMCSDEFERMRRRRPYEGSPEAEPAATVIVMTVSPSIAMK